MTSYSPQSTDASDSVHKQVQPRYFQAEASHDSPNSIHSVQAGWQARLQSSSVIAAPSTAIESVLLFFFNNLPPERFRRDSTGGQTLFAFTYLALFFSLSATFSSLLLTDELAEVHERASRRVSWLGLRKDVMVQGNPSERLDHGGSRKTWGVMWHWFFMVLFGYMSVIGQMITYIWVMESKAVGAVLSSVVAICWFPLLLVILPLP